jgi:hypothetical protein
MTLRRWLYDLHISHRRNVSELPLMVVHDSPDDVMRHWGCDHAEGIYSGDRREGLRGVNDMISIAAVDTILQTYCLQ